MILQLCKRSLQSKTRGCLIFPKLATHLNFNKILSSNKFCFVSFISTTN